MQAKASMLQIMYTNTMGPYISAVVANQLQKAIFPITKIIISNFMEMGFAIS